MSNKTDGEMNNLFVKLTPQNRIIMITYAKQLLQEQKYFEALPDQDRKNRKKVKPFKRND